MFEVVGNEVLGPDLHRLVVRAPRVAKARRPGQFVIVRKEEGAERVPLTICDADAEAGTITLIVQAVGASTRGIVSTAVGRPLRDVVGPLGRPTHLEVWGRVACVGGGAGTAVLYPIAKALAEMGNKVRAVIGARSAAYVILTEEIARFAEEVQVVTEDGSAGRKGLVTLALQDMLDEAAQRPDAVFAVGPVGMMSAVAAMTRPQRIPTFVSLNPIMIDGTGMCGGCRVTVGGQVKFACVDGPEFDAHQVDFDGLANRLRMYRRHELEAVERCRLTGQVQPGRGDKQ